MCKSKHQLIARSPSGFVVVQPVGVFDLTPEARQGVQRCFRGQEVPGIGQRSSAAGSSVTPVLLTLRCVELKLACPFATTNAT